MDVTISADKKSISFSRKVSSVGDRDWRLFIEKPLSDALGRRLGMVKLGQRYQLMDLDKHETIYVGKSIRDCISMGLHMSTCEEISFS